MTCNGSVLREGDVLVRLGVNVRLGQAVVQHVENVFLCPSEKETLIVRTECFLCYKQEGNIVSGRKILAFVSAWWRHWQCTNEYFFIKKEKNTDTAFRIIFYVTARRKSWQNVFLVWVRWKHWQCAARCILLFLVYSTKGLGQIWEFSVGIFTLCCEARPTSTFSGFMSLQQPSQAMHTTQYADVITILNSALI